jgi:hypothetical protein
MPLTSVVTNVPTIVETIMDADTTTGTDSRPIITFVAAVHSDAPPEVTFRILSEPATHLEWSGTQAPADNFKLLTLDAPDGPARPGTGFTSTGANGMGMQFHDRSVVTDVMAPALFAFTTESRLERKHRPAWLARFRHRYEVHADGTGSRIVYTGEVYPQNYRPFWLHPMVRPLTRIAVPMSMARNMKQLARLAESADPVREGAGGHR